MKSAVRGQERVLVVDDAPTLAQLLARTLEGAGFAVAIAMRGLDGLALAKSTHFDLVILDLVLPDIEGRTVLTRIRQAKPEQLVLILSARGDVHARVSCLELGACDYVTKPFDLSELVARVRLRLREQRLNNHLRSFERGGYRLDLQRRTVTTGHETLSLSTREFVLLEFLMRRAGDVCTRDELLDHVWGYTFDPGTNVLEVYVARLRHKLEGDCIQTVRNVGYAFVGA
jgi:two-component system OmpR family response regulator